MSDADPAQLHVVALSTLFPHAAQPSFGIFVERSMAALAQQPGIALTVIAPIGVPPWPLSRHPRYAAMARLPERERWNGLDVLRPRFTLIPGLARRNAAAVAHAVLPTVSRMRRDGQADVLSAQFFWPDGPAAARIADAVGLPFSVKARGSDINLWGKRPATTDLVRNAARCADGVLAVSQALRADMAMAGMDISRVAIHYTGLDASRFRPLDRGEARRRWAIADNQPVILSVGALTERKGQALVIAAMATLPPECLYILAGDGLDRENYRRLAASLGVADRVRFIGSVDHGDLPSLYAAADVMALPSASEGLANAWVEALACGVPLVLGDIAPAHELLADCTDLAAGEIVARDPHAIASAIRSILANPPLRATLAAHIHQRFDWDRHGRELAEHLRRIAGTPAAIKS